MDWGTIWHQTSKKKKSEPENKECQSLKWNKKWRKINTTKTNTRSENILENLTLHRNNRSLEKLQVLIWKDYGRDHRWLSFFKSKY